MIYSPVVLFFLAVFGLFFGYYLYVYCALCWKLRKFRGPPAFPLVGNCYTAEAFTFLKFLGKLRSQYGRIYTLFNFSHAYLVICDPVVIRRVLSDPKTFLKGSDYTEKFAVAFGDGLVTANGEKHRKGRSVFGKYFIRSSLAKFTPKLNEIANKVIAQFFPDNVGAKAYNVESIFARLALRSFMNFALGSDLSDDPKREHYFCERVSRGSNYIALFIGFVPMWSWLPIMKDLKKILRTIFDVLDDCLKLRKEQLARGEMTEVDDCLAAMIRENLTEKEMADHFITLISAGHDTTAFFMSYTVYLLAQHPVIQEKLYSHIMDHMGDRDEITADDFASMRYLQCVMMESLRLYAVIPLVSRYVSEETYIKEANVTLPAGATVLIPFVVLNRDPQIWENPSEFRPARFEEKGNDFTSAKDGYFPFGYGARTCIGNTFAQIESAIVLCKLLKRFTFEPDPNFKMQIRSGISLTTASGVNVIMKPRKSVQ